MSEPAMKWLETKQCSICGKRFSVLYPDIYTYKRRKYGMSRVLWFCSYTCVRAYDADKERGTKAMDEKISKRDRKGVLLGIIDADKEGMSAEEYLASIGYTKPTQAYYDLKRWAKDHEPELHAQLPDRRLKKRRPKPKAVKVLNGKEYEPAPTLGDAMEGMKQAADQFFGMCDEMGLKVETPEANRIQPKPVEIRNDDFDDRTTVSAIRVDGLGEFYHDKKFNSLDWRTDTGDEVSMAPWSWGQLADDLPRILKRLGVDTCSE